MAEYVVGFVFTTLIIIVSIGVFISGMSSNKWDKIGECNWGKVTGRIPHWLVKWIERNQTALANATHKGEHGAYLIIKGRRYKYSLYPSSQGGTNVDVYRKKRHL